MPETPRGIGTRRTGGTPPGITLRAMAPRAVATIAVVALCALLLRERLSDITLADIGAAMAAIPAEAIATAFVLGLLSHLALAGYDLLALTRIGRHLPWPRALKGGFSGTVMSQVLGFGIVTGSLARGRIYRANGISTTEAVALTGLVATGFFLGLANLLAVLALIDPGPAMAATGAEPWAVRILATGFLGMAAAAAWATAGRKLHLRIRQLTLRIPDGRWLATATGLAAADLVPAALCLGVLLPEQGMPGLAAFVAIYITAVALGHIIGSPGAAGPFEGILFLGLPAMGAGELAAGILIYRLVYYMPPFALAVWFIARAGRASPVPILSGAALRNRIDWVTDSNPQAEAELSYLGDKHIYMPGDATAYIPYGISGRIWLVMGDPVGPRGHWADLVDGMETEAHAQGAVVAVYKATEAARTFWQDRGWVLQPLGQEATVDVTGWSLDGSHRRELRRKIRTVEKAGITLERHRPGTLPLDAMAPVAEAWHAAKGHQQTFSMGHWEPRFNARHAGITAHGSDGMIAFATFWTSGDGREWMLDLMRQGPDVPNGTMHAILAEAAGMAHGAGARRLNLCMAPLSGLDRCSPVTPLSRLAQRYYETRNHRHGLQGMRRFKEIFSPSWTPRYVAGATWLHVAEAMAAAHHLVNDGAWPEERATARSPLLALPGDAPIPFEDEGKPATPDLSETAMARRA